MAVFIVTYDLRKQGQDYQKLWDRLAEWKAMRVLDSVWAINWNATAAQIRDDLLKYIDGNDGLLFVQATSGAWNELNNQTGPTLKSWIEGK